jgi:hypothetical protein
MKPYFTIISIILFTFSLEAQWNLPVTFENTDEVRNWTSFANNDLPDDLKQVENPSKDAVNGSDSCCEFTIDPAAGQWVGAWSNAYGYTAFTSSRHIMQIMVYSDTIHTIGVRGQNPLEPGAGTYGPVVQVKMSKLNEWELITLDFSAAEGITYSTLTFFADLNENRTQGSVLCWDNLGWDETVGIDRLPGNGLKVYPNPVSDRITVEYPGMRNISLVNMQGRQILVLEFPPSENKVIDLSFVEPGIYFLRIDSEHGTEIRKIIKS